MTPEEHLKRAEMILDTGPEPADRDYNMIDLAMSVHALCHIWIAIAAESGVPHHSPGAGGGESHVVQAP